MARSLTEIYYLTEKSKKTKDQPGRKPRAKADVEALEEFIAKTKRLKELLESKQEYDRISSQLRKGKHGKTRVIEMMREYFANAFRDTGDAFDEALEPILRLEDVAIKMKSKVMKRANADRVLEILRTQATPAIQKAIAKAEALAKEDPTKIFFEEWEIMDLAESYGFLGDERLLREGFLDWVKTKGKMLLGQLKSTASWFRSKLTPILSSIATDLESIEITFPPISDLLGDEMKNPEPEPDYGGGGLGSLAHYKHFPK